MPASVCRVYCSPDRFQYQDSEGFPGLRERSNCRSMPCAGRSRSLKLGAGKYWKECRIQNKSPPSMRATVMSAAKLCNAMQIVILKDPLTLDLKAEWRMGRDGQNWRQLEKMISSRNYVRN